MDYEKAYKAVLRTATQWIKDGCTDKEKICLECVFPELRESEDERIRKQFINEVKEQINNIPAPDCCNSDDLKRLTILESWLAYLEKQKDKREFDFAEGKVEGVRQTCQEIKDAMSLFEPKDLTPFEFTFRDYIDSAIRYCLAGEGYQQYIKEWAADLLNLEKQKEQKPIELSDNFEIALEEFLMNADSSSQTFAEDVKKYANKLRGIVCKEQKATKPCDGNCDECTCYQAGLEIGRSEQKPAAWSEEDEDYYDAIIAKLEVTQDDAMLTDNQIDFLKSLPERFNLQPQQEWSEEDENAITIAIRACRYMTENFENSTKQYEDAIERLKSLRPPLKDREMKLKILKYLSTRCSSLEFEEVEEYLNNLPSFWRPSEELIDCLERVIAFKNPEPEDIKGCESLLEQLEKLI